MYFVKFLNLRDGIVMTDNIIQFKVIEKAKPTKSKDFENKPKLKFTNEMRDALREKARIKYENSTAE